MDAECTTQCLNRCEGKVTHASSTAAAAAASGLHAQPCDLLLVVLRPVLQRLHGRVCCGAQAVARVKQLAAMPLTSPVHAVRGQDADSAVQGANQQNLQGQEGTQQPHRHMVSTGALPQGQ